MKKQILAAVLTAGLVLPVFSAGNEIAAPAKNNSAAASADAGANNDKILYSLGYLVGANIKEQLVLERGEEDSKAISQGMRDSLLGRNSQTDLKAYKPLIQKRYEEDAAKIISNRKVENEKFLSDLKKDKKIKVLPNGALVRTVKEGRGKNPKDVSSVKVHYEGSLLDGTVFDSSYKRNAPAQFALNAVISCWTEGLQQMKSGGKAKLFCPSDTAYGDRQNGSIPPASLLVFDVELLEIFD
jgi:FKBP-type peptidyl-prolyl cis-trans isomerase